jgi:two-component system, NarL family, nitrate/nitrite response regulator NarL
MHILLADDHDLVRDGIKFLLSTLGEGVTFSEARSFPEAFEHASAIDGLGLIILDLYMPGMNGLAGLAAMRKRRPDVPIVILSASVRKADALSAIDQGAAGYIPKTLGGTAMVRALQLVLAGETFLPSFILRDDDGSSAGGGPLYPDAGGCQSPYPADNPLKTLTKREREVLALLVRAHSNKEIAKRLDLQEITVKVHLKNVFRKLGALNRTEAVRIAMQLGWDA